MKNLSPPFFFPPLFGLALDRHLLCCAIYRPFPFFFLICAASVDAGLRAAVVKNPRGNYGGGAFVEAVPRLGGGDLGVVDGRPSSAFKNLGGAGGAGVRPGDPREKVKNFVEGADEEKLLRLLQIIEDMERDSELGPSQALKQRTVAAGPERGTNAHHRSRSLPYVVGQMPDAGSAALSSGGGGSYDMTMVHFRFQGGGGAGSGAPGGAMSGSDVTRVAAPVATASSAMQQTSDLMRKIQEEMELLSFVDEGGMSRQASGVFDRGLEDRAPAPTVDKMVTGVSPSIPIGGGRRRSSSGGSVTGRVMRRQRVCRPAYALSSFLLTVLFLPLIHIFSDCNILVGSP